MYLKSEGGVYSRFYTSKNQDLANQLGIPCYRQLDSHSCGFLSILAVVHHFHPNTPLKQILDVVQPTEDGCGQPHLIRSLKKLGVKAQYRKGLEPMDLYRLILKGVPVIVTVEPEWYSCDHWTVIRGLDPVNRWVYLTNYEEDVMDWKEFRKIWSPCSEGLVCKPI